MKILLREFGFERYVWKTAKYHNNKFYVSQIAQSERNIVSVVNDNRSKYVQCSSCGKVFRKNDIKFDLHRQNAASPSTCFDCPEHHVSERYVTKRKLTMNPDGSIVEKLERDVCVTCGLYSGWVDYSITDHRVVEMCKMRRCGNATAEEIHDIFTTHPGIFDDIITVDKLLDDGCTTDSPHSDCAEYELNSKYEIWAVVNKLGIVDRFVTYDDDYVTLYYSKRYDTLFTASGSMGHYIPWVPDVLSYDDQEKIRNDIAKLYR